MEQREKLIAQKMSESIETIEFYKFMQKHGQAMGKLVSSTKEIIASHHLTVLEAKGFMEYMKMVIEGSSYIHESNEQK